MIRRVLSVLALPFLMLVSLLTDGQQHPPRQPVLALPSVPSVSPAPSPSVRATPTHATRRRVVASAYPLSRRRVFTLDVTAYSWTGNRTASGVWPAKGQAASNMFPFGTRLRVPGIGVVTVTDRIGHGSELDIYLPSLYACREFGRRHLRVTVLA